MALYSPSLFGIFGNTARYIYPSDFEMLEEDSYPVDMRVLDHIRIGIDLQKAVLATLPECLEDLERLHDIQEAQRTEMEIWRGRLGELEEELESRTACPTG